MNPGRELDALVAEKLIGWKYIITPFPNGEAGWICIAPNGNEFFSEYKYGPRYSTNIAAAWEVVEKLMAHEGYVCWEITSEWKGDDNEDSDKPFFARVCLGNGIVGASSDTVAHAICLAALKVVGVNLD